MRELTFCEGVDDGATSYVMQSFMGAVNRMKLFNRWFGFPTWTTVEDL